MAAKFEGTGFGRDHGKRWLENFKPKPIPISVEDILKSLNKYNDDVNDLSKQLAEGKIEEKKIMDDEKPPIHTENENKQDIGMNPVNFKLALQKAVNASEFVPSSHKIKFVPMDEKPPLQRQLSDTPAEEKAQQILTNYVLTLTENPGEFDDIIKELSPLLTENITTEELLKESIYIIFDQAMQEANFSYSAARLYEYFDRNDTFKMEHGQFRKTFYAKCKTEFTWLQNCLKGLTKVSSPDISKICNVAILFGELYNNMKLKDQPNPLFKKVISQIVELFLQAKEEGLIRCLVRLLKLVGPEMDRGRPKDTEEMFNKVRDFYLNPENSHLSDSVKKSIWHVYKLHTRDWDRSMTPTSPSVNAPFEAFSQGQAAAARKSSIDWNDFYTGNDAELHMESGYYDTDSSVNEEEDAYEEFLRMSGQI